VAEFTTSSRTVFIPSDTTWDPLDPDSFIDRYTSSQSLAPEALPNLTTTTIAGVTLAFSPDGTTVSANGAPPITVSGGIAASNGWLYPVGGTFA
jgi:hypothetical protein